MDTDRLIRTLAADGAAVMPMTRVWWAALLAALIVAAVVFFLSLGVRPDFAAAAQTPRFLFKFVATLALFVTALGVLKALARPGASVRSVLPMLLLAPALLLAAVAVEMMVVPSNQLESRWLGTNALLCMTFIPLIGIGPLAAFLMALRHGAPTRPALAGGAAGLVAGGLAATFYAAHCFDDSPLFVATWYTLAVAFLALVGAVLARFVARW